jgi:hypothetical protein
MKATIPGTHGISIFLQLREGKEAHYFVDVVNVPHKYNFLLLKTFFSANSKYIV